MPAPVWRHWFRSLRRIAGAPPRGRSRLAGLGPALDELERRVVPAAPSVVSITRAVPAAPNTDASTVSFTVTFSEAVTGVDPTDFTLATTGTVTAAVAGVTPVSGSVYTVAVDGISGAGTVGLNLTDDGTIHDLAGDPLVSGGPSTFAAPITVTATTPSFQPIAPVVADVNGDGKPDLVFANGRTVDVALGNGDGTFQPTTAYPSGGTNSTLTAALAVADLNGDGKPDLVVVNGNQSGESTVGVLRGNGDGTFQAVSLITTTKGSNGIAVADLNRDGKPDLAVSNSTGTSVSVLLGNGDGTFQPETFLSDPLYPYSVAVADLNGDGKPDLVCGNSSKGESVFLGNGDGTFQPQQVITAKTGQTEPMFVAAADLNGDGKPDLVVTETYYSNVYVLLGNGDGTFQPAESLPVGTGPEAVAVADLNGDGKPDIVTANAVNNTVSVLPGNGDGTFQPQQILTAGYYPDGVAVADLNGDGKPDVAVANGQLVNNVGVYLNTTTGGFTGQTYTIGTGTTTAVAASASSSVYGQPVTFTATVAGGGAPTGNVEFYDDTTGADLGAGTLQETTGTTATWTYTTSPTQLAVLGPPSIHAIRAVYTPTGAFVGSSGTLSGGETITPAPVTLSGITANNKVYDGTIFGTLNTAGAKLVGLFPGDVVNFSTDQAVSEFGSPDVGTGIEVFVSGLTFGGPQGGDYTLTVPTMTANITPAPLTVIGVTTDNKVYDGTTAVTLHTAGAALSGVVTGDDVTLSTAGATGAFASKDAGAGITVNMSGFSIGGTAAGNYTFTQPTTAASITPAPLTVTGVTADNKVYDGTTAATLHTAGAVLSGVVTGDNVTLTTAGATGTFASKDAGTGITVTAAGLALGGTAAGDYALTQPTTTANITPALLTVTGVTADNKVYDGTTAVTLNTAGAALSGVVTGDNVTLTTAGATGAFASKDAGTGITVTAAGLSIGGTAAGDYTFTQPTTAASITPAPLTVTGVTADNKVYDGTTAVTLNTAGATLSGVATGDDVTLSTAGATGAFASKDAGTGITVNMSGFSIGGTAAGNYTFTQPTTAASITPAPLTVTGVTADNKVYDGTTAVTLNTAGAALSGVVTGDNVTLTTAGATGTFASKDAGTGITVTAAGLALGGTAAGDYALTQPTTTANITPAPLTVIGVTADNKVYDGTTAVTLNTAGAALSGVVTGDDVTLSTAGATGAFASKDAGAGITVNMSGFSIGGTAAGNYTFTQPTTAASITPAPLTVTGVTADNKVYDGTTAVTLNTAGATLSGVATGDDVTLSTAGATGAFASKDAGTGITVTVSGLSIGGTAVGNYTLTQPTTTANITPLSPPPPAVPPTVPPAVPPPPTVPPVVLVGAPVYAVGADAGGAATITVYNPDGSAAGTFTPFPGTTGGVRTAVGDFLGNGSQDVVAGTGPGATAEVKVLDARTGAVLLDVTPFAGFTGGVFVAAGDVNGDGRADLVITPDLSGGPRVEVYRGGDFLLVANFFGIDDPNFRGGARAAVGDLNGDGAADLVISAGFGGGPRVSVYDGKSLAQGQEVHLVPDFFLFEPGLRNGAYVAVGDVDGDGYADFIGGGGPGGGPRVLVVSGKALTSAGAAAALGAPVANFFAGDITNRGGIRVAAKNLDNDKYADVVVGDGTGAGSAVTAYLGKNLAAGDDTADLSFDAIAGSAAGVYVG